MASQESYKRNLVRVAVTGSPKEDIVYAIFTEFVMAHKVPSSRFILYPQVNLKWNPEDAEDRRSEVPDFGIGHFALPGPFKLRCGVEAKRAVPPMARLPAPGLLMRNTIVKVAFNLIYYQAEDQAKAAFKNNCPLREDGIHWILLVGPYWKPERFGPFTEAQLNTRVMRPSDSGDHEETTRALAARGEIRELRELYVLNSPESFRRLEQIIASTEQDARPYISAMHRG